MGAPVQTFRYCLGFCTIAFYALRTAAWAATPAQDVQADINRFRTAAASQQDQAANDLQDWFVRLTLPVQYNSNPVQDFRTGSSRSPASLELDPEFQLGWVHTLRDIPLTLSARAGLEHDAYPQAPSANYARVYTTLKAGYDDAADDQAWQPFASYAASDIVADDFSERPSISHNLALGVDKIFNFGPGFKRLPIAEDSTADAVVSLGLSARVQRRFRSIPASSTALIGNASATWYFSDEWSSTIEFDVTRRYYDSLDGFRERDWLVNPVLTVSWSPDSDHFGSPTRRRAFGKPTIDLEISFAGLNSNDAAQRFREWQIGPVISARWWF